MDPKIEYTYRSPSEDHHELWMYGTLARLNWSRFEFRVPSQTYSRPTYLVRTDESREVDEKNQSHNAEDRIDVDFDSDNEIVAFGSDNDNMEGVLDEDSEDEVRVRDSEDEGSLLNIDGDETRFDSEDEALDDGREDWF
jgi:hypothetical protein